MAASWLLTCTPLGRSVLSAVHGLAGGEGADARQEDPGLQRTRRFPAPVGTPLHAGARTVWATPA